jgi:hypothetical protein
MPTAAAADNNNKNRSMGFKEEDAERLLLAAFRISNFDATDTGLERV